MMHYDILDAPRPFGNRRPIVYHDSQRFAYDRGGVNVEAEDPETGEIRPTTVFQREPENHYVICRDCDDLEGAWYIYAGPFHVKIAKEIAEALQQVADNAADAGKDMSAKKQQAVLGKTVNEQVMELHKMGIANEDIAKDVNLPEAIVRRIIAGEENQD